MVSSNCSLGYGVPLIYSNTIIISYLKLKRYITTKSFPGWHETKIPVLSVTTPRWNWAIGIYVGRYWQLPDTCIKHAIKMSLSFIVLNIVHICSFSVFIDIVLCVFHLSKNSKYIFAYLISSCVYLSPSKNSFPYYYKGGFSGWVHRYIPWKQVNKYLLILYAKRFRNTLYSITKKGDGRKWTHERLSHVTLRYTLKKRNSACIAVLHVTVTIGPSKLKSHWYPKMTEKRSLACSWSVHFTVAIGPSKMKSNWYPEMTEKRSLACSWSVHFTVAIRPSKMKSNWYPKMPEKRSQACSWSVHFTVAIGSSKMKSNWYPEMTEKRPLACSWSVHFTSVSKRYILATFYFCQ